MSVSAIEGASPGFLGTPQTSASGSKDSDKQMFLQLLVAQLRYQDPLNPTDSGEFLAQSAQFTALEKMEQMAAQTAQLVTAQVAFGASSLVGRTITYASGDGGTASGRVTGVRFDAGVPVLDVDGTSVALGEVRSVTDGSASPSSSTP